MRIAIVHSFYRSALPSGENRVVEDQARGLAARGHHVLLVRAESDALPTHPAALVRTAVQVARHSGEDPTDELLRFAPDVVHVHNLFPNFGYEWLASWRGPVVATLHNYRSVCAAGVLSREGHLCTLCPDGDHWAALRHRCYRDSAVATLPMVLRTRRGVAGDPLLTRADKVIVLSAYTRAMFERFGLPPERMVLLPNGVPDPGKSGGLRAEPRRFVAVGRLSAEKGFRRLLREWPAGIRLDVLGEGPEAIDLKRMAPAGVRFLGLVEHHRFLADLPTYSALVIPGINPEGGFPTVMAEALAAGVPLVARRGGVVAPLADRWRAGASFSGREDLPSALASVADIEPAIPRSVYEQFFTEAGWLDSLEELYSSMGRSPERDPRP